MFTSFTNVIFQEYENWSLAVLKVIDNKGKDLKKHNLFIFTNLLLIELPYFHKFTFFYEDICRILIRWPNHNFEIGTVRKDII